MPAKTLPDPKVIQMLKEYRLSLIAREEDQTKRLARSWLSIESKLSDEMLLLARQIEDEKLKGSVITEQLLRRMSRYEKLQAQMKVEILNWTKEVAVLDIEREQLEYGTSALKVTQDVIKNSFRFAPAFDRLPIDAVETYVGYLGDGTPLYRLLKEAYPDALDGVINSLLQGTAKGINPNQIAYDMARSMGMGLERITLIARTEQLRVTRSVSAQQYRASGIEGVMKRVATKDDATCLACLVSDGEVIPLDQELDDHPRGRCVAVFQPASAPLINWEKGQDWFERQSPELQKEMMGDKKFTLWQEGQFKLSDLRQTDHDPVWGNSPRVATLQELTNVQ